MWYHCGAFTVQLRCNAQDAMPLERLFAQRHTRLRTQIGSVQASSQDVHFFLVKQRALSVCCTEVTHRSVVFSAYRRFTDFDDFQLCSFCCVTGSCLFASVSVFCVTVRAQCVAPVRFPSTTSILGHCDYFRFSAFDF